MKLSRVAYLLYNAKELPSYPHIHNYLPDSDIRELNNYIYYAISYSVSIEKGLSLLERPFRRKVEEFFDFLKNIILKMFKNGMSKSYFVIHIGLKRKFINEVFSGVDVIKEKNSQYKDKLKSLIDKELGVLNISSSKLHSEYKIPMTVINKFYKGKRKPLPISNRSKQYILFILKNKRKSIKQLSESLNIPAYKVIRLFNLIEDREIK